MVFLYKFKVLKRCADIPRWGILSAGRLSFRRAFMRKAGFRVMGLVALILVVSGLLLTCEVGMGKSVDTLPPRVSITYPPTTSVIRGSFVVTGTADDETSIASVNVSLKNLETGVTAGTWRASYNAGTKKWNLQIQNDRAFNAGTGEFGPAPIPDGRYEVMVRAVDSANRQTTSRMTYFLDNTPPVLLLSQPASTGAGNASLFSEAMVFKGDTWDLNYVDKIEFNFFDFTTGAHLTTHTELNPGGSWDIPVGIRSATATDQAYLDLISGLTPADGALTVTWTATAFDNAYRYTDPAGVAVDTTGNASRHYFLRSSILRSLEVGEKMPKAELLSRLDNSSTFTSSELPPSLSFTVLKDLRMPGTVITSPSFDKALYNSLAIDPFNKAPTVNIIGMVDASDTGPVYSANNLAPGTNLPIRINLGPDQNPLRFEASDSDQIKITIYPETAPATPLSGYNARVIPESDITDFGSSLLINFTVPGVSGGYRMVIYAVDVAGETARRNDYYYNINQGVPLLESVRPTPVSGPAAKVRPDGEGKFKVTVVGKDKEPLTLRIFSVDDTDPMNPVLTPMGGIPGSASPVVVIGTGNELDSYTWTLTFTAPPDGDTVKFAFQLNDGVYDSSYAYRNYTTDTTFPILYNLVSPAVSLSVLPDARKTVVDGASLRIDGFSDIDLDRALFLQTSTPFPTPPPAADWNDPDKTALATWIDVDTNPEDPAGEYRRFRATLPLPDVEGRYYIWYRLADDALDEFGNPVYSTALGLCEVMLDKATPVLIVTGTWGVESYKTTAPVTISGTASDPNGVDTVLFEGLGLSGQTVSGASGDTNRTWSVLVTPPSQGVQTVTVRARDVANKITSQGVQFFFDNQPPQFAVSNLSNNSSVATDPFTVNGIASDLSGIDAIEYSLNAGDWTPVTTSGSSWSHIVSGMTEGVTQTIRFRATDNAGHETMTDVLSFALDTQPPVIEISTIDGTARASWVANAPKRVSFPINGIASDASGLTLLEYSIDNGATWLSMTDTPVSPATPVSINWTQTVAVPEDGANDGIKTVRVRATDRFGKQTQDSFAVRFDTMPPVVTVANLVNGDLITAVPFTLNGTWTDAGGSGTTGGLAKVEYRLNAGAWTDLTVPAGESSWSQSLDLSQGLAQTIRIRGTDAAGNVSPETTLTGIRVDTEIPAVLETEVGGEELVYRRAGQDLVLSGTASDTLGLNRVEISALKNSVSQGVVHTDSASPESWSYTLPAIPANDGLWVFTIKAIDSAGRESISLIRNVRIDATAPSASIDLPAAAAVIGGTTYTFSGTAGDTGGSGVKAVRVAYASDGTGAVEAAGTASWSATVNLADVLGAEGAKTMYVQAEDLAGNLSSWTATQRNFVYDTAVPVVTVTGDAERDLNTMFTLEGTASDNYGVASVSITQQAGAGAIVPVTINGPSGTTSWSLTSLPRNPSSIGVHQLNDGTYTYRITATDLAAKTSLEHVVTVRIDRTAPEVLTVTAPAEGQTGVNALSGSAYTLRGAASDIGVGMARLYYAITGSATAPALVGDYQQLNAGNGNWSIPMNLGTGPADPVWDGSTYTVSEGSWYLHVMAEDSSGNRTDALTRAFDVDHTNPVVTETAVGTTAVTNRKAGFTLEGAAVDTHGIVSFTVTQKLNDGSAVLIDTSGPVLGGTATNRTWTLANLPRNPASIGTQALVDGLYEFVITATDIAGKTHIQTRTIRFDATGPDLQVMSPAADAWLTSGTITVSGSATDLTGVKAIYYVRTAVEPALPGDLSTDAAWVSAGWTKATGTSSWTIPFTGLVEGQHRVWIRAIDTPLNVSDPQSLNFGVDISAPSITATNPAANIRNLISITGTASDTNALEAVAVTVTQRKDSGAVVAINTNGPSSGDGWTNWTLSNLPRNPSSIGNPIALESASDGLYEYVITVTDVAGKTSQQTRTVRFDRTAPTLTLTTDLTGWKPNPSLLVSGTSVETGSGLATIEYSLNGTDWFVLSSSLAWTGTVPVVQGTNNLSLRATDLAGNITVSGPHSVMVDTANPEISVTSPSALVRVNGTLALPVTLNARDIDGSGIDQVLLKVNSTDFSSGTVTASLASGDGQDGNWTASIPAAMLDLTNGVTYQVHARARDASGRTTTASFPVFVDKTAPTVAISSPANNSKINKTIAINGTAGDNQVLSQVTVEFQRPDNSWVNQTTFTGNDGFNWSLTGINTATLGVFKNPLPVRVTATDEAGNTNSVTWNYEIDQDSDRPVIRLSNVRTDGTTTLINTTTVSGVLLDDDGTVGLADFAASENGTDWFVATANPLITNPGNPLFYDVDTRSFQFAPSLGDGQKYIYFRVTDQAGTTFTTPVVYDAGQLLTYPKIQFSTDVGTATGQRVGYKIDTNPPDIHGDIHFDSTSPWNFTGASEPTDDTRLLNNTVFGGTNNRFALRIRARDTVGIESIAVSIDGTPYSTVKQSGDIGDWEVFTTSAVTPINVESLSTGGVTVTITVTDNSGQTSNSTRQILIDNSVPEVDITSHAMYEQVTGDLVLRGTATDVGGAGIQTVQYRVGNDAGWKAVEGTFSWSIAFTNTASNVITTVGTYANATHAIEQGSTGIWRLPITIRATDKMGNIEDQVHYLDIDPDGDKPKIFVLYPDPLVTSTLGGTIRIFGSAVDNESVSAVYMMIDVNNDGNFDAADRDILIANGYSVTGAGTEADPYQFLVNGTASWNRSINTLGEFNPGTGEPARPIRFRVRAQDNNLTYGAWSEPQIIYIDNNVPQIGSVVPLKLVQYTDGTYTTIAAQKDYVAGMYIRGEWFLVGSVWDESGISTINLTGSTTATLGSHENTWFIRDGVAHPTTGKYNYMLRIPVGRPLADTTAGRLNYSIYVEDASDPTGTATQAIQINYDNKAPVSEVLSHGGSAINNSTNLIIQSNRHFTITSEVTESDINDSGFDRLVFFFVRNGTEDRVYNPMLATGHPQNRTNLDDLDWTAGDIPRRSISGVGRPTEDSLTHAEIETNFNIRAGGLVRIAGVDRMISSVDRGLRTVTFSPAVATTFTDAEFAYAQVVNNTTVETGVWDGSTLTNIINDDGDGMIESVRRSGGTYEWDASINSLNIPDGPIELHYIAYDKAGNAVAGFVTTFVANNRPRLAKVRVGTDLGGDNQFSSDEISTFFTALSGEESALVNLASSSFRVKGDLVVIPEFVGGNGTLRYTWATNGVATTPWDGTTLPATSLTGTPPGTAFTSMTERDTLVVHSRAIVIEATDLAAIDDVLKLFSFGFWDETEETIQATNSQWARLNAPLLVDVVDGVAPRVVISPFFWNSATDNSLFGNSRANGHIELEDDLPDLFDQANGLFDEDPKVSGSISIRGTAYDDRRLSALYAFIGDGATTSVFTFTGAGDTKPFGGRTYARMATFDTDTGDWTGTDRWATDGWRFTVITTDGYLSQAGHKVNWQLDINTALISNVAALDRMIRVVAEDGRPTTPNPSSEAANPTGDITTNNVPFYRVDVVPYITGISTSKRTTGGLKDANIRSSKGLYSIIAGTDATFATVNGFNLNPNAVRIVTEALSETAGVTTTSGVGLAYSGATADRRSFSLSNNSTVSGYLEVFTNGIRTLNNVNNNDAKGGYTGTVAENFYNMEPDRVLRKNLRLTDDRYLRFFRMRDTGIKNAYYPSMIMDDNRPVFGIINPAGGTGTYFPNTYQPQRIRFNEDGTVNSREELVGALAWEQMAMAKDGDGRYYHMMQYNYSGEPLNFIYDRYSSLHANSAWAGYTAYVDAPSNRSFNTGNNAIALETNRLGGLLLDRYQYPKLHVKGTSVSSFARIYAAYYDDYNGQIIFRNFQIGTNAGGRNTALFNGSGYSQFTNITENTNAASSTTWNTGRITAATGASKHFDMAVTTDNRIIIVYYDESLSRLVLRYSDTLVDGSTPNTAVTWTTLTDVEFPEYVGQYVSLTLDDTNGIHIAAFDSLDADLKYMYLTAYNADAVVAHTIDAAASVGLWTNISIRGNIPYIAYYNSSEAGQRDSIKLAYSNNAVGSVTAGVEDGFVTNGWETLTVPSLSPAQGGGPRFKQVNLGFDLTGRPVLGYLGTNLEFGTWLTE